MANKIKNISVNQLEDIVKRRYANEMDVEWNGLTVHVRRSLDFDSMFGFVDSVVKSCFDKETGEYHPEVRDLMVRVNIMKRYANFNIPTNVDNQYDIAIKSGAVDMLMEHINRAQFNEIIRAIDAKIQQGVAANVEMVRQKMSEVVEEFNSMRKNVEAIFSGMTPEDMKNLVGAMSQGLPTEEAIVKAFKDSKVDTE